MTVDKNFDVVAGEIGRALEVLESVAKAVDIHEKLETWSRVFSQGLQRGGCLFFAGNGGSYADALHLAAEFTGKMGRRRPPLSAHALGSNGSSVSAIGNDYAFEEVFSRELIGLARPSSGLVVMSTSGKSRNILRLVETAQSLEIPVLALTGRDGGDLRWMCDCIMVPADQTERIQEVHILLGHILSGLVESNLAGQFFEWDE
jgi:D-sedoheptulose 7-phosphate isomerase